MWWILIPTAAVLLSAVVALVNRRRVPAERFDRAVTDPAGGPATKTPPA